MAADYLPHTDYSCHCMGSFPTLVHCIKGSFYYSCPCFRLRHLLGPCKVNSIPRHRGVCFLASPIGPISSWIPCPTYHLMPGSTHPEEGYGYLDRLSTAGIFCRLPNRETDPISFFSLHPIPPRSCPFLFSAPVNLHQTTICSATCGLLLLRDPSSAYHVINPFLNRESRAISLPRPLSVDNHHEPAVLVVDLQTNVYFIVCAFSEPREAYRFDVFSSLTRRWTPGIRTLRNCGFRVIPTTGVSCGTKAYWVATGTREILLGYHVWTGLTALIPLPCSIQACNVQLGRLGDSLCLVVVKWDKVELYGLRRDDIWAPFGFLNVNIRSGRGPVEVRGNLIACSSTPRPIRFESFKVEVLLWVDGEVVVWESNDMWMTRTRLVNLPRPSSWGDEPVSSDSVAYVHSSYRPGFHRIIDADLVQPHWRILDLSRADGVAM